MYYYYSYNGSSVFVKEGEFFEDQGGLKEKWGLNWFRIEAEGIEHARLIGEIEALGIQGLRISNRINPVPVRRISKCQTL